MANKKAVENAPAKKLAVKKTTQKTSKAPSKKVGAAGPTRQDNAHGLHEAISKNNIKKVQALITQGADANAKDGEGWSPLHVAAELGYTRMCQLLVQAGADIHAKSSEFGQTALHLAAMSGVLQCCKFLILAGADIHTKNAAGSTPLHVAAEYELAKIYRYLIQAGADVDAHDNDGMKPMDLIVAEESELASLLRGAEKPVKIRYTRNAPRKALRKPSESDCPTWNVQAIGTALVRGYFTVEAATRDEAWEMAYDRINNIGLTNDELEFFEIRLEEQPGEVWLKKE